jgi:hypothetical protein
MSWRCDLQLEFETFTAARATGSTSSPAVIVTAGPVAATRPGISWPGVSGYAGKKPASWMRRSVPHLPASSTRNSTSPGAGSGSGADARENSRGAR